MAYLRTIFFPLFLVFIASCSGNQSGSSYWLGPSALSLPPELQGFQISLNTNLFPSYGIEVPDYVSRCMEGKPTQVRISAPEGVYVSVANEEPKTGDFTVSVSRSAGQSFSFAIDYADKRLTHFVRCLPEDFEWWTVEKFGPTQAEWYQLMPRTNNPITRKPYPAIFDSNGVPVWWTSESQGGLFAQVMPNGEFAWLKGYSVVNSIQLNGQNARERNMPIPIDAHDLIMLPNGNILAMANPVVSNVDLSSWGLSVNESILDNLILEFDPYNNIVWSFSAYEHIPVSLTPGTWRNAKQEESYDPYHFNAIEVIDDGVLVSFRNLDAVYKINKNTKAIEWTLGGAERNERLTILNDILTEQTPISGQHDVRMLEDGTLTIHENGSHQGRTPRALRFLLDLEQKTATVIENLFSAYATPSTCCGSARKLPGGNWVIGYGGTSTMMEVTPDGSKVFALNLGYATNIYRAVPITWGRLDRASLRAAMDMQYPSN